MFPPFCARVLLILCLLSAIALGDPAAPTIEDAAARPRATGRAELIAVVSANEAETTVTFRHGKTTSYELGTQTRKISGAAVSEKVAVEITNIEPGVEYHFQITATNSAGTDSEVGKFRGNVAPVARPDKIAISGSEPVIIPVLRNDSDPDGTDIGIKSVGQPMHGTARRSGDHKRVIYTPDAGFSGQDTFSYTVTDQFGATATASVTVSNPGLAIAGAFGATIAGRDGKSAGYLRLLTSKSGSFTGHLDLGTKHYHLLGRIGADGKFRGSAVDDDGDRIAVELNVVTGEDGVTIAGEFGGDGEWTLSAAPSELTSGDRRVLEGRYTVELPSPGNTTPAEGQGETVFAPEGNGWMSVKIDESGTARLKGKAGDGRAFSAKAYVGGTTDAPTLSFYATPESSILSGTLSLAETITGDVYWFREKTDADYYPEGFELTVTANGRRFEKPEEEKRALEVGGESSEQMTITISGGEVPGFSRELRLSEEDDVRVVREGLDELQMSFDRKSGIFKGKFRILNDLNRRAKITGVLLQGESRGTGVFLGVEKSGKVELTVGSGGSSTPPATPTIPEAVVP